MYVSFARGYFQPIRPTVCLFICYMASSNFVFCLLFYFHREIQIFNIARFSIVSMFVHESLNKQNNIQYGGKFLKSTKFKSI